MYEAQKEALTAEEAGAAAARQLRQETELALSREARIGALVGDYERALQATMAIVKKLSELGIPCPLWVNRTDAIVGQGGGTRGTGMRSGRVDHVIGKMRLEPQLTWGGLRLASQIVWAHCAKGKDNRGVRFERRTDFGSSSLRFPISPRWAECDVQHGEGRRSFPG
jgi:hypothetical protein